MQHKAIEVIRNSLAAASSALDLLESLNARQHDEAVFAVIASHALNGVCEQNCESCDASVAAEEQNAKAVERANKEAAAAAEVRADYEASVASAAAADDPFALSIVEVSKFGKLMEELNHPRFHLRTFAELSSKLGLTNNEIINLLDENEVEFVLRTRRSDSAKLIGLAERN